MRTRHPGGTSSSTSSARPSMSTQGGTVDLSARSRPHIPPLPTNPQQVPPQSPVTDQASSNSKSVPPKCKTCLEPFRGTVHGHAAQSCPLLSYQGFTPLPKADQVKNIQGKGCSFCSSTSHTRFFCLAFNEMRTKVGLPFMIVRGEDGKWTEAPDYENAVLRERRALLPDPLPPRLRRGRRGARPRPREAPSLRGPRRAALPGSRAPAHRTPSSPPFRLRRRGFPSVSSGWGRVSSPSSRRRHLPRSGLS
mgnify:CR=1 FL=1